MGDDACWLSQTCLSCGRFLDLQHAAEAQCPHCGAERVAPDDNPLPIPGARTDLPHG